MPVKIPVQSPEISPVPNVPNVSNESLLDDGVDDEILELEQAVFRDLCNSPKEPPVKKKLLSVASGSALQFDDSDSDDSDDILSSIPSQGTSEKPKSGWLSTRGNSQSNSSGTVAKKPAKTLRNLW